MPILLKLFQKIAEENTSKLILQGHHYPDTKTRERKQQKRKLQANITDEYRCKNPQQNFSNRIQQHIKNSYIMIKMGVFQECEDSSIYAKSM